VSWGHGQAGRCQFNGCNRVVYRLTVTQEPVNISEKAHIYAFSEKGPRGWGPLHPKRLTGLFFFELWKLTGEWQGPATADTALEETRKQKKYLIASQVYPGLSFYPS